MIDFQLRWNEWSCPKASLPLGEPQQRAMGWTIFTSPLPSGAGSQAMRMPHSGSGLSSETSKSDRMPARTISRL